VAGVPPEDPLVEVLEGRLAVGVLRNDPRPVVSAVASGPLPESVELAGGVAAVVSALAPAAFPLVLKIAVEGTPQRPCCGLLAAGVVDHSESEASELFR